MITNRYLVCFGTRPEAIKLCPLIKELQKNPFLDVIVCATGQHGHIFDEVMELFGIIPAINLSILKSNQSLEELSSRLLMAISGVITEREPNRIIVQGDTATAMVAALAGYYKKIPVAHVEAGLRSEDIYQPWPEEVNRKIISSIADIHFAPTENAAFALRKENISKDRIFVTGNTVIDSLSHIKNLLPDTNNSKSPVFGELADGKRLLLATCHRRENHGEGIKNIAASLSRISERDDTFICLSVHPNPNVHDIFFEALKDKKNILLVNSLSYLNFVDTLIRADLVLTDSGGIQEEAPTFGKPVLVLRETTERPEGVIAGTSKLVGSNQDNIVRETSLLLDNDLLYRKMAQSHNPYGDGSACIRISKILSEIDNFIR